MSSLEDLSTVAERIEEKLECELESMPCDDSDLLGELSAYSRCFAEVLKAAAPFASLLRKIKDKYEGWVLELSERERSAKSQFQVQLISLQGSLLQEMEEKKALHEELQRLQTQLREARKHEKDFEQKYLILYEKLREIAEADTEQFPPSEYTWKTLNTELRAYKRLEANLRSVLADSQKKEAELTALVLSLQRRTKDGNCAVSSRPDSARLLCEPSESGSRSAMDCGVSTISLEADEGGPDLA